MPKPDRKEPKGHTNNTDNEADHDHDHDYENEDEDGSDTEDAWEEYDTQVLFLHLPPQADASHLKKARNVILGLIQALVLLSSVSTSTTVTSTTPSSSS